MSIVSFADSAKSKINAAILHDVAAKNNFKITSKSDEEGFLLALQSADAIAQLVDDLPDYIDPRLAPVPVEEGTRTFRKPDSAQNSHNGWSHITDLVAAKPSSDLLKGKTCVIKDNMTVAGVPYTCGIFPEIVSEDGKWPIPEIDSIVVQRLLDAGARIVGTSTCEHYSMSPLSYTSANGPVHNPWLKNFNTGGSSSGSACLLSLRLARKSGVSGLENAGEDVDIAMGGDQAGSIRLPAAYCGLYGLKPTHGLVPYTAIAGLHPMIDHAGPMGTSVEDVATMLTVLAGYDGLDPRMTPETPMRQNVTPYHEKLHHFVSSSTSPTTLGKGLRIGIISESLTSPGTSSKVAEVVKSAAVKHFAEAGATIEEVSVPMHLLGPSIWTASCRHHMAALTCAGRIPDVLTHNMPHFSPRYPPDQDYYDRLSVTNPAMINILIGETLLVEKYPPSIQGKAHRHVFQLRAAYDMALNNYDVLITPTTPDVAPPHPDMRHPNEGGSTVTDKLKLTMGCTNNTAPFNATGHPGLSVPCGWTKSRDGSGWLPVGMQIIGKRWDDLTVLKAAKVFEAGGGGLGDWPGRVQ